MSKTIEERFNGLVVDQLLVEDGTEVLPESRFVEDLGADSLDLIELLMGAEEEFEIEISDEEGEPVTTVQQAIELIKSKVK